MTAKIQGTISRININHVIHYVTFMLEKDETVYRLEYDRCLRRPGSQALDLTQPGDVVEVEYWPSTSKAIDGDIVCWENQTVGATAATPSDKL
jgi:hypothetical protein